MLCFVLINSLIKKTFFLTFYVLGSYFRMLAVILASDFFNILLPILFLFFKSIGGGWSHLTLLRFQQAQEQYFLVLQASAVF